MFDELVASLFLAVEAKSQPNPDIGMRKVLISPANVIDLLLKVVTG